MMVLTGIHIFILQGPPQKKYTPVNWGVNKHLLYFNDILYHKIDLCVCVGGGDYLIMIGWAWFQAEIRSLIWGLICESLKSFWMCCFEQPACERVMNS